MKSPIIEIAKKVCPAVITVIVSKDLPKAENFYSFPFGGKEYVMPNLKKGEKVNVKHMNIQQDSLIMKLIRSFIHNDTRANTFTFINNTIKKGFEILSLHIIVDKDYDRSLCQNLIKRLAIEVAQTYIEQE